VNPDRIVSVLIVVGILGIIAAIGVIAFSDVTNAIDIDSVASDPDSWEGKQVTLEGVAGLTTDHMFVLWGHSYESQLTVKWVGEPSVCEGAEIAATGEIVIEELFGKDRLYLVASELRYLN
jgi:hypothetical protein